MDTGDTVPSVLLFFDNLRFLFNVGEGFQRFCVQHRVKLSKTNGIFVTRTSTDAAGGLPGVASSRTPRADMCFGVCLCCSRWQAFGQPGLA